LVKDLINKGSSMGLADALRMESELYSKILDSPKTKAAIKDFLKRKKG
jgi:enoyl-CoA hydratase/carnithine racemase